MEGEKGGKGTYRCCIDEVSYSEWKSVVFRFRAFRSPVCSLPSLSLSSSSSSSSSSSLKSTFPLRPFPFPLPLPRNWLAPSVLCVDAPTPLPFDKLESSSLNATTTFATAALASTIFRTRCSNSPVISSTATRISSTARSPSSLLSFS